MKRKILIIGLDGARLDVIQGWCKEGCLPNLNSFFNNGIYENLESVYPIHSIPAWVSFSTGKNPGNHGLYDILIRKENSYGRIPPTTRDISGETIWDILTRNNITIGVVNHPVTYPTTRVNGIMVCGWLTPSEEHKYAYPNELWNKLKTENYKTTFTANPENKTEFFEEIYALTKKQIAVTEHFIKSQNWDFTFLLINGTEILHHHFASFIDPEHPLYDSKYEAIVRDYYIYVDHEIGRLIEIAGSSTNVFVISDHGFTPYYGKLYLNRYFSEWGLLKLKTGIQGNIHKHIFKSINFLKKEGKWIYPFLPGFIKGKALEKYRSFEGNSFEELIDWSRTLAYCPITNGGIYLNLKNREPEGIVEQEKYEQIREKIIERILSEPELKAIIENVVKKEELYSEGIYFDQLPDLYIKFKKTCKIEVYPGSKKTLEPATCFNLPKEEIGYHTINGIFLAKGPDIKGNFNIQPKIIDIAPTILHLFGLPVPRNMDGKVLIEIINSTNGVYKHPITYENMNDKEKIRIKIRDLRKQSKV